MIKRQACSNPNTIQKPTLLAMLESKIDTTKAIVVDTNEIIDLTDMDFHVYKPKIVSGEWAFYEEYMPRRMLVTNTNWRILSFDSKSRFVCVEITSSSGSKILNFTLPEVSPRLYK